MWGWGWQGSSRRGGQGWNWWPLLIIAGIFFFTGAWRWGWWVWPFLFIVVPMAIRWFNGQSQGQTRRPWRWGEGYNTETEIEDEYVEKPKRTPRSVYTPERASEKPKRRPVYTVGDDGELVEVTDDPQTLDELMDQYQRREQQIADQNPDEERTRYV